MRQVHLRQADLRQVQPHQAIASHSSRRTALLADALADTVAELRLIEAGDMVAYMRTGRWANIADLVHSSAELSFAEGTLTFACSGDFAVGYAEPASVSLDLEFQHGVVTVFFTLTLAPRETRVEIRTILFALPPADDEAGTRLLSDAVAAARIGTTPRGAPRRTCEG